MDSLQASRISGGNSARGRRRSDFYPTPPDVTVALMRFLNLPRTTSVWEPATGEGDMAGVLQTYFETVYATDILDGTDFLKSSIDAADWIITNPPFSLAEAFIRRAAELGKPFAFLLKSQYWNATCRLLRGGAANTKADRPAQKGVTIIGARYQNTSFTGNERRC